MFYLYLQRETKDMRRMKTTTNVASATPESVWALLHELTVKQAETDQRMKETDRVLSVKFAETDRQLKETGQFIKEVGKQIGGMGNSHGDYAEEFFYNALLKSKKNLFGEKYDAVLRSNKVTVNTGFEDEYDILLVNGRAVCVVEVKYKADSSDLAQKVLRKAQTFRVNFPQHKDKKVYLALAGMLFHPLTEQGCRESGIAIIKQVGDTMVVYDENVKAF